MVDAVIFDMDGLMFDTERMWQTFWEPILAKRGITYIEEQGAATCGTAGAAQAKIMRSYYGEDLDAEQVWVECKQYAHDTFMSTTVPKCKGLDELLAWLAERNVPMAIASSSDVPLIEHNTRANGVRDYFSVVVSGDDIPRSKPFPDVFLIAAEKLGVKPENTLVLEDAYNGVRAGHAGGFITVMVPSVVPPDDEMREKADLICEDLLEVRDLLEAGKIGAAA